MKIINYCKRLYLRFASPKKRANIIKNLYPLKMGKGCEVYNNVSFGSEPYLIEIGDNVRITNGVSFITHDGGVWVLRNSRQLKNADIFGEIKIGNNVHIGINTIIMPGTIIGDNVIIGAGAVVTKPIPSNSIAVGIPAKVIKTIDEYYEKNLDMVDYTKHMSTQEKKEYLINKFKNN